ncbi:helix-turn-helix domain-containing protein [uncultured Cetobacterium sp.]|uniref:helix-turn-helix domain-containing protein n=1 Tax=uncultured Cetobacterium sp. TaxID=527638 RepID=UPI0026320B57|nr:helix-turn-helix domain-containing protein [uncultured Cetobacterium sp.]
MNVTSIHFKIMYCLRRNIYSISEIAQILNISEFKAKRYIKDLEYLFEEETVENIHNKINKVPKIIEKLRKDQSLTPEERQMYVILKFLETDIINLSQICEEVGVTRRTLTNDLNNLKEILEKFHLEIKNLTRYGIILEGKESDKRGFFNLYLIKIFIEKKYLPKIFDKIFNKFKNLKEEYEIHKVLKEIFVFTNIKDSTFVYLDLEIKSYIAILRKKYQDSSTDIKSIESEIHKDFIIFLKKLDIYTNFEINLIIEISKKKYRGNLQKIYPQKTNEAKKLIKYISENMKTDIKITKELLLRIMLITIVRDYKREFNINEFYIFNNAIGKAYILPYKKITELLKNYFQELDSFDLANLTMTFLSNIYLDTQKKIGQTEDITIVYHFLHKDMIKDLCEDIGLKKDLQKYKLVLLFDLEEYLKKNNPKVIITFEDIDFSGYNIEDRLVEFNFPITKYDKLKLKPFLENV